MQKHLLGAAFVLCSTALVSSRSQTEHALPVNPPTSRDTMKPSADRMLSSTFTLAASNGMPFDLSKTRGKVVIVNFWATWCGGCKYELPYFVDFDQKYRAQGLQTIGVSMDDSLAKAKAYFLDKHISYPTVLGNDALGEKFHLGEMPLTVLIDRSGKIAITHSGVIDKSDFEHHIQQLLRS